jgi:hypothetical protein
MEISKLIFLGKLFIYVGYGIKKKKSEKLFESAIYSKKKKSACFLKNISQVHNVQSFKNMQLD